MSQPVDAPPPASPYGPADDLAPTAAPPTSGDSPGVTRSRRTLGRLAIVMPIAGVVLSAAAIAVQVSTGGGILVIDSVPEFVGPVLIFIGPTLLVLGLHMIIWRALVRPLARMTSGARTGTIIGVGAVLSFFSVIFVILLVLAGLVITSALLDAAGTPL